MSLENIIPRLWCLLWEGNLLNIDNIELTKKEIKNVKKKYEKNLYNVDTNMIKFTINDQTFFDILLAEIRENQTLPQLSGKRKCLKKKLNYTKAFSNQKKNLTEQKLNTSWH